MPHAVGVARAARQTGEPSPGAALLPDARGADYNKGMLNGHEGEAAAPQPSVPPESPSAVDPAEQKLLAERKKAETARRVQALNLMRARIREQLARSGNERYTQLLQNELQQIESDLAKLV
jgi:hypothetical protein